MFPDLERQTTAAGTRTIELQEALVFTLDAHAEPDYLLLRASGELDLHNRDQFREQLTDHIDRSHQAIVLDLSDLSFIDSSGLGALLALIRVPEARRPRIVRAHSNGPVRRLFQTTRLDLLLDIEGSVEAALATRRPVGSAT